MDWYGADGFDLLVATPAVTTVISSCSSLHMVCSAACVPCGILKPPECWKHGMECGNVDEGQ
ncbi:Os06g0648200 [Oryza sativa Japonica Group]|jgi:hypothetical protein|uniref:Os06g0648100 protein n=2 Tax=Oryza sativa subsp. japonica TaxID=39947 RepID=A0A0P0WZD5_ORYSJ|nr:hypothetical protein EE612_035680 [Oryza sativa]KAB8103322.1 hypothetical protein EE612_035680 [Oryza sativa]BAD37327.1 unknown protein [Oryza sativa Japonica Group]BAH93660.1 Os06g0648100 [Oryza sativa Japonica Group]BAS98882.1 Os06g0648200 [Oryza sativa Japonica Group]|eukprot:NP_001174932.1 Os06g0648100 [Oryza sativa Japonica Group]